MANTAKLRDQARAYEARGQWREAIGAYHLLIESSEGEDVDIGVWNRIGDLHLRLGETDLAIQAYESAVNAYVDVGLYNNAIALCRKVLRLVPGRAQTYLRLGQISAAKGFFADARQNFLEYADRMRKAGKLDASLDALKEFADLSPDPADVRRLLVGQLMQHGRKDDAVEQLRILLGWLEEHGDAAGAADVRAQITTIDPTASTEPLRRQARATGGDDFAYETGEITPPASSSHAPAAPEGVQHGADIEPAGYGDVEIAPMAGLESTMLDGGAPKAASAGRDEEEDAEGPADLPLMELGPSAPPPTRAADPSRFGEVSLDEEPIDFSPGGDDEPLPFIDLNDPGTTASSSPSAAPSSSPFASPSRLEELRARAAAHPEDKSAREALVDALHDHGLGHEVPQVLEDAHRALAGRAMYRDAVEPISELIRLRPDDPGLLQKRVEYAFRSGDREEQVVAYLALGRHYLAQGDRVKGEAVFKRVLELDPGNQEARGSVTTAPQPTPASGGAVKAEPRAAQEAYIDLGALILEDDGPHEPTTRFVVEEREPSGDEDRDFADMLAHFRQKVSENIEVEDSSSHYDLGLAFKEMGLIDEAIAEFQVALRGGANPLATLELLGQCFVERGQYAVAVRVLERAQRIPGAADSDLVGVLYQLGRAEEALGRREAAIEYYERVLSVDIRFRDAVRRVEVLRDVHGAAPL